MRYYDIKILNADGSTFREYSSQVNGQNDPGALNVEIDAFTTLFAQPVSASGSSGSAGGSGSLVRVWGIPLTDLAQSANFNNLQIQVFAGMAKGLPLANPQQAGLIVQGYIYQAFGNWIGGNMTLDLIVFPGPGPKGTKFNIAFNWTPGQTFAEAMAATLRTAFPGYTAQVNVSPNLVQNGAWPETHIADDLVSFSQYIKDLTYGLLGTADANYRGVDIAIKQNAIVVRDGSTRSTPKVINFVDLIGQITWSAFAEVEATCVMRADIQAFDFVKLPPGQVTISQASLSQFRQGSVFTGSDFMVTEVHHVGNFRQPNAEAWVTVLKCAVLPAQAAA